MPIEDVWESQKETQIKACIQISWGGKRVLFFSFPFFFCVQHSAQEEMSRSNSLQPSTIK